MYPFLFHGTNLAHKTVRFIPKDFVSFDHIFKISISSSFLVFRNTVHFHILTLHPAAWLNSL